MHIDDEEFLYCKFLFFAKLSEALNACINWWDVLEVLSIDVFKTGIYERWMFQRVSNKEC